MKFAKIPLFVIFSALKLTVSPLLAMTPAQKNTTILFEEIHTHGKITLKIIQLLLSYPNAPFDLIMHDDQGFPITHWAIQSSFTHLDKIFLTTLCNRYPETINLTDSNGWTMLHWAANNNNIDATAWLLDAAADPTYQTKNTLGDHPQKTAFEIARTEGHIFIAEFILRKTYLNYKNTIELFPELEEAIPHPFTQLMPTRTQEIADLFDLLS